MTSEDLQHLQNQYNQLVDLIDVFQKDIAKWQQAAHLAKTLQTFYSSQQWIALHEKMADFPIETNNHYHVLSEDGIYDTFTELSQLANKMKVILEDLNHF
ncbi:DUF4298 domain-containing protein [Avibacterium avium]|uniref:DUF4298 domain-containing protein n=1 Tax=Avibacterium volantium TaxID=762 RepID=A0A3S4H0N1_AVIVO|nr:DUF4298 domain-containing protein [Avibacterium volantium]VEB25189.1 Uncharacterised protein [Avibacterium volantium]